MNHNVYWVLELALRPERLGDFSALMHEMVGAARDEHGMLNYEWNMSEDAAACHVYVRYRDSAAVLAHLNVFSSRFSTRFLELAAITRMCVYGAPDANVRLALAPYGAVYFAPLGGFARHPIAG